jgi:hypothetical protein
MHPSCPLAAYLAALLLAATMPQLAQARELVGFSDAYSSGTVVVKTSESGGGEYAIHGTNKPGSVGGFVSYGCIRMYNADVLDLYNRVSWGATVVVSR